MRRRRRHGRQGRDRRDRRGGALVVTILLILILTAVAQGSLALASAELRSARAAATAAGLRLEDHRALEAAVAALLGDTLPALGPGGRAELADGAALQRAAREIHILSGGRRRTLLWAPDPVARLIASEAVVSYGGVLETGPGAVTGAGFRTVLAGEALACDPLLSSLDSVAPPPWTPRGTARLDVSEGTPGLGPLEPDSLLGRLPAAAPGSWTMTPSLRDGVCDATHPDNWGEPTRPAGPCGTHRRAAGVDGSVVLRGGEGAGLLVVRGDLTLEAGAIFSGLVVVTGAFRAVDASRVDGMVRAGADVSVGGGSRIEGRACPVLRALASHPSLRHPFRLAEPSFLHGLP